MSNPSNPTPSFSTPPGLCHYVDGAVGGVSSDGIIRFQFSRVAIPPLNGSNTHEVLPDSFVMTFENAQGFAAWLLQQIAIGRAITEGEEPSSSTVSPLN